MKKLIYFLTILLSIHYLLAQNENRLKAINQVTGDRLQDENRLKAEGYRLKETESQTKDNREAGLASEHQIGQRAKTTTNHELPTANGNNLDQGLNCYLMMNPSEIKEIEDIFGFTRMNLLPSRKRKLFLSKEENLVGREKVSTKELEDILIITKNPLVSSKEFSVREVFADQSILSSSEDPSISTVVSKQRDVIIHSTKSSTDIKGKISSITDQIEEAKQASREGRGGENSYFWDRIVTKLEQATDSWNKFDELLTQGNEKRASLWKQAAKESEASAERMKELIVNYISAHKGAVEQLEKGIWNAYYLSDAFTWSLKSEEALEKASLMKGEQEIFWKNLAEQYKDAADYERKASEACHLGKENEEYTWVWAGRFAHSVADYQIKASRALAIGKTILAAGYREASITSQQAVDQLKKAIENYIVGKDSEGYSWYWAGRSLQKKADYQAKAGEAKDVGKMALAESYKGAGVISGCAAEQWKLSAERKAIGKESEGVSWGWQGSSLQLKADYQAKTSEAQEAGKAILTIGYREAVEISQRAADARKLAAESKAVGKESEGESWDYHAQSLQTKAGYQAKAIEAQEAGKIELAAGYQEIAKIFQKAADARKLAAESKAVGKESEGESWDYHAQSLQTKAGYQAKTSEAEEAGKAVLVAGYLEAVEISESAANSYKLAAEKSAEGRERESISWHHQATSLQAKADYQAKAIEAQEAGKAILAEGYREAAETSQKAADARKLSAERKAAGKESEWNSWGKQGKLIQTKAGYQAKAIEAKEAGKIELAAGYLDAIETCQKAADAGKLAAESKAVCKESEGESWDWQATSLQTKADYQARAIEAQEAGKAILAEGYREAAEISQRAADARKLSAERKAAGKESEGNSWDWQAESLQSKADYQARAIEAQEAGKAILAEGYREAAEISQRAADARKLAAERRAVDKESEGDSWDNQGSSLQSKAEYQVKAYEAERIRKDRLVVEYRKAAEVLRRVIEEYKQSAQAYAASKEYEGICRGWIAKSLGTKVGYQVKAIEAQENGQKKLAAVYETSAIISQYALDFHQQSLQAVIQGRDDEGGYWHGAGKSLQSKADYEAKAIEVLEAGKEVLAARYKEIAETFQKASEYYQQSAQNFALGKEDDSNNCFLVGQYLRLKAEHQAETSGKITEKDSQKTNRVTSTIIKTDKNFHSELIPCKQRMSSLMKEKALFVYCEKWLAEGGSIAGISDYVINILHTLKKSADYQLIRSYEEYRNDVWKAHESGDDFLAFSLTQVVEDIQQAIEDNIQQAKASESNNTKLSEAWQHAMEAGKKLAEYRKQYIQLSVGIQSSKTINERQIVKGLETIVEYLRKAAEACALNKEQEYTQYNNAVNALKENVRKLEEAVTAFGKSLSLSNEPELAEAWKKVAEEYQRSAEFDEKVAEEELQGNKEEVARLKEEAKVSEEMAKTLEKEAQASEKK